MKGARLFVVRRPAAAVTAALLIAAAFSMYNRYVDGLATWQPKEREAYREMGEVLAHQGYIRGRFEEKENKEVA